MDKWFYFETTSSWTNETSHQENGKKYLLAGLDSHNIIVSTRFQTQLICPDDNSILANHIKINPYANVTFAIPTSKLTFKTDFLKKGKYIFSALLIKDTNQLKKVELEKPLPGQVIKWPSFPFTFKVINQKQGELDERGDYKHELNIEPFSLGIEGLPAISRIIFNFSSPLPDQKEVENSIRATKLYNSSLLTESAGKTFTMRIRRWWLSEGNKTLSFHCLSDFDLDSFQEKTTNDNLDQSTNNPSSPNQQQNGNPTEPKKDIKGLILGGTVVIFAVLALIIGFLVVKKRKKIIKK